MKLQKARDRTSQGAATDESLLEWQAVDQIMPKVKRNLRPLLRFLDLSGTPSQAILVSSLNKMAESFRKGGQVPDNMPLSIIPERYRRFIVQPDGTINRNRYE